MGSWGRTVPSAGPSLDPSVRSRAVYGADLHPCLEVRLAQPDTLLGFHDPGQPWEKWACPIEDCGRWFLGPWDLEGHTAAEHPGGPRPTSCCGRIRTSASGSCTAAARRRRADATGRPVGPARRPRWTRGPAPRGRRSARSRRSQRRLAAAAGPPPGGVDLGEGYRPGQVDQGACRVGGHALHARNVAQPRSDFADTSAAGHPTDDQLDDVHVLAH
jgi:hypothetical protein